MKTKAINFCGAVRFNIPETWTEQYSDEGGGAFFATADYLGILRLDLLDYDYEAGSSAASLSPREHFEVSARRNQQNCHISDLPDGSALSYRAESTVSEGDACQMHWWEVGIAVAALHRRLVMFSYTVPVSLANLDSGREMFSFLDHSIRTADYRH